jgi:ubiquinone/menaquinone biosynthesis C-methylase UbiE
MMTPKRPDPRKLPTDWTQVADWYDQLVGGAGSEFHRHVVLPGVMKLLGDVQGKKVVDVACGQGVLCRLLAQSGADVTGVDAAEPLIRAARAREDAGVNYIVGDARFLNFLSAGTYDAAACVLAIQNIHPIQGVFEGVARSLKEWGTFTIVMIHPCFRGAKETSWGWDGTKVQYRRVDRYMLPRKAPIITNPGQKDGIYTWTFHKPIEAYIKCFRKAGFLIDALEEWCSHKVSDSGPRAAAENDARKEIPMFLAIRAVKAAWPGTVPDQLPAE